LYHRTKSLSHLLSYCIIVPYHWANYFVIVSLYHIIEPITLLLYHCTISLSQLLCYCIIVPYHWANYFAIVSSYHIVEPITLLLYHRLRAVALKPNLPPFYSPPYRCHDWRKNSWPKVNLPQCAAWSGHPRGHRPCSHTWVKTRMSE
jgi:hypothetical protein